MPRGILLFKAVKKGRGKRDLACAGELGRRLQQHVDKRIESAAYWAALPRRKLPQRRSE